MGFSRSLYSAPPAPNNSASRPGSREGTYSEGGLRVWASSLPHCPLSIASTSYSSWNIKGAQDMSAGGGGGPTFLPPQRVTATSPCSGRTRVAGAASHWRLAGEMLLNVDSSDSLLLLRASCHGGWKHWALRCALLPVATRDTALSRCFSLSLCLWGGGRGKE